MFSMNMAMKRFLIQVHNKDFMSTIKNIFNGIEYEEIILKKIEIKIRSKNLETACKFEL